MVAYREHFSTRATPQSEAIPGKNMARNNAGGFAFTVDDWTRLDRFLILGAEGGTYYVQEKELTKQNAQAVMRCIQADGLRTVARIVEISHAGRAPKNDPALFALAMAASLGDEKTRQAALAALPKVARIGTHLFHFVHYVEGFRGWGRSLRRAVADWYQAKSPDDLAYQLVKYQQRDGWSHRDLLRLAKPVPVDEQHKALYAWAVGKPYDTDTMPLPIRGYKLAQSQIEVKPQIIRDFGLTHEMLPTEWLAKSDTWRALLDNMPMTAMLRNLGRMTSNGALKPLGEEVDMVCARLTDKERIKRARLHPLNILVALRTYAQGHGEKGSLKWEPISQVADALNDAFYHAFDAVESTGKRHMLALDVSGSMRTMISGMPLSCREASVAMAMVAARTEPKYVVTAFASGADGYSTGPSKLWFGYANAISAIPVSPKQRLDDVMRLTANLPFGGTDCALPMLYALEKGLDVDAFFVYTDSETWAGHIHPAQALQQYRERTGIAAKLIVVGMVSNDFSIADPNDGGMLDVVGFDTAAPTVMADFVRS